MGRIVADAETEQRACAQKIITFDNPPFDGKHVIGIDVSYSDTTAYGSAIVMDFQSKEIVHSVSVVTKSKMEYIPGFFFLREGPILIELLKRITYFGPVLIDGNGILHPRRCGLASQVGLRMDRQTIGVAKTLHLGTLGSRIGNTTMITENEDELGAACWLPGKKKPIFVSVGHRLSLETAIKIVKETSLFGYPEPLRQAHILAKERQQNRGVCNCDYT